MSEPPASRADRVEDQVLKTLRYKRTTFPGHVRAVITWAAVLPAHDRAFLVERVRLAAHEIQGILEGILRLLGDARPETREAVRDLIAMGEEIKRRCRIDPLLDNPAATTRKDAT